MKAKQSALAKRILRRPYASKKLIKAIQQMLHQTGRAEFDVDGKKYYIRIVGRDYDN